MARREWQDEKKNIDYSSSNTKIAKGATIILLANVVNMLISIVTNFVLPQNLSTDTYASIKLYQLFLSYIGILHFGAVDGIYLRYGGKDISRIDSEEIGSSLSTFRVFQLLITLIGISVSLILRNPILLVVSLMIMPTNLLSYFKYLFQACGEFKSYSWVLSLATVGLFFVNIGLVLLRNDNYLYYIVGYLIVNLVILIYTEFSFSRKYSISSSAQKKSNIIILFNDIKNGILLTLGNFASILMTSIDRWFVKILIGTGAFAQYAFAVSIEHFLNTAATPVSITFYNGFCNNDSKERINLLRKCVIVLSALLVSSAFVIKFMTDIYITKYRDAVEVVFYLFAAQFFYVVIKSIYINLYKVRKKQRVYFVKLVVSLVVGFVFNTIAYYVCNVKESYAIATLCAAVFWLIIVLFDFEKDERLSVKEWVYMVLNVVLLIVLGKTTVPVLGFVTYLVVTLLLAVILLGDTVKKLFLFGINTIKQMKNKKKSL